MEMIFLKERNGLQVYISMKQNLVNEFLLLVKCIIRLFGFFYGSDKLIISDKFYCVFGLFLNCLILFVMSK